MTEVGNRAAADGPPQPECPNILPLASEIISPVDQGPVLGEFVSVCSRLRLPVSATEPAVAVAPPPRSCGHKGTKSGPCRHPNQLCPVGVAEKARIEATKLADRAAKKQSSAAASKKQKAPRFTLGTPVQCVGAVLGDFTQRCRIDTALAQRCYSAQLCCRHRKRVREEDAPLIEASGDGREDAGLLALLDAVDTEVLLPGSVQVCSSLVWADSTGS
jgi:hypothetical protein